MTIQNNESNYNLKFNGIRPRTDGNVYGYSSLSRPSSMGQTVALKQDTGGA